MPLQRIVSLAGSGGAPFDARDQPAEPELEVLVVRMAREVVGRGANGGQLLRGVAESLAAALEALGALGVPAARRLDGGEAEREDEQGAQRLGGSRPAQAA